MKVMIAVFLGLVIDEDSGSCDEGIQIIGVRFTPMNAQMKSLADMIRSDSERMAGVKDSDSSLGASAQPGGTGRFVSVPDNN